MVSNGDQLGGAMLNQIKNTYSLLGLFEEDANAFVKKYAKEEKIEAPQEVVDVANERLVARQNKDWAKSDELRAVINQMGYDIKDAKDGYTLTKKQ